MHRPSLTECLSLQSGAPEVGEVELTGAVFGWGPSTAKDTAGGYTMSCQRLAGFLSAKGSAAPAAAAVVSEDEVAFAVGPLTIKLPAGGLVGVVGQVGCGKSTFIMGLLGELVDQQTNSEAACGGGAPVGYLSQTPAVVNGSLRQNITLGCPFNQEQYTAAVEAACLGPDIAAMPAGDETEIGERGTTVSGGQKARIGFARCKFTAFEHPCRRLIDPSIQFQSDPSCLWLMGLV